MLIQIPYYFIILFSQKFAPLDELQNVSLIIFHSNFTSQTTMELVNILRGRIPALSTSGNCFEEIVDVTHSKKPPISALLWNRNDFKVSNFMITAIRVYFCFLIM